MTSTPMGENTDSLAVELRQLRDMVAALLAHVSPFITTDEMCVRYHCTTRTLNNLERSGKIPFRRGVRWNRNEVMEFERKRK